MKLFYLTIFVFFSLIFLAHYIVAGQAVYGDGIYYYAYLHSVYFDHDLNFSNEYRHIYNYEFNNYHPDFLGNIPPKQELTSTGKVDNIHLPGMAILLFPFYVAADLVVMICNFLGADFLRNGYSNFYQIFVGLGAVFYSVLGLFISEKILIGVFKPKNISLIRFSILSVVLASSFFYYCAIDVVNSHFASFLFVSLFFYCLLFFRQNYLKFILLGLFIGAATTTRLQEASLFLPLFLYLIMNIKNKKIDEILSQVLFPLIITTISFLVTLLPLLIYWQYLYGNIFGSGYFGAFGQRTNFPPLLGSLFDFNNGLFSKTPFMALLLLALPYSIKKFKKETILLLSYFLLTMTIVIWYGGWVGAAYGGRMFISTTLLFLILAYEFFLIFKKRNVILVFLLFVTLNFVLILNFMLFSKMAQDNTKGLEQPTKIRIEKLLKFI